MDITKAMTGILTGFESAQIHAAEINFSELAFVELADGDFMKRLPNDPAIYFVLNETGRPVYIGKAVRLQERWRNHHCLQNTIDRTGLRLAWVVIVPAFLMLMESLFISVFAPAWNQGERVEDDDYLLPDDSLRFMEIWSKDKQRIWADIDPSERYVPVRG